MNIIIPSNTKAGIFCSSADTVIFVESVETVSDATDEPILLYVGDLEGGAGALVGLPGVYIDGAALGRTLGLDDGDIVGDKLE